MKLGDRLKRAIRGRDRRTAALLKAYRRHRTRRALTKYRESRGKGRMWRRKLHALRVRLAEARRHPYPHLRGDLDCHPSLLRKLEGLGRARGQIIYVTSGLRSYAEQKRLWDSRASNPFPVARPGTSRHESGEAADCLIGGRPIQPVVPASQLRAHGLEPLAGDAVHVEG